MSIIMKRTKKRNVRTRRALQHRLSILLVSCVIVVLAAVLSVKSISLYSKYQERKEQIVELEKQLAAGKARAEEIEEQEEYVGSDEYIKDVAKEKLGLVYENEVLYIAE